MVNPMFQRLLGVYAQRYITEKLLESPAFHRLARATHAKVTEATEKGMQKVQQHGSVTNAVKETLRDVAGRLK
ncbi:hypothetical protein RI367_001619 [Sorochytrium milnesiophthora]